MKTVKQIEEAIAAMIIESMCASRQIAAAAVECDEDAEDVIDMHVDKCSLDMAAGALAWAADLDNAARPLFEQWLNQIIHSFDQAAAAVRDRRAEDKTADGADGTDS